VWVCTSTPPYAFMACTGSALPVPCSTYTLIWILLKTISGVNHKITGNDWFLGAFEKPRKATVSFVASVRTAVCNKSAPNQRIFMKFCIWIFFECLSRKVKFDQNLTRITGTLHEDLCTFMIISRWILLRMRNVSDKSCTENQNTHFMFSNVFPKIVPFVR
jgi:hypothetical protein